MRKIKSFVDTIVWIIMIIAFLCAAVLKCFDSVEDKKLRKYIEL